YSFRRFGFEQFHAISALPRLNWPKPTPGKGALLGHPIKARMARRDFGKVSDFLVNIWQFALSLARLKLTLVSFDLRKTLDCFYAAVCIRTWSKTRQDLLCLCHGDIAVRSLAGFGLSHAQKPHDGGAMRCTMPGLSDCGVVPSVSSGHGRAGSGHSLM